jgi:hypothetical protein
MKDFPTIQVKVDSIELAPWNYKMEDEVIARKLATGMQKNGYVTKIAIAQRAEEPDSEKYEVIDGNHRVMAFKNIGVEEVQATFVGRLSKAMRQRIGIELNELRFANDSIKFAQTMTDLIKDFSIDDLESTMPYSRKEIETFGELMNYDWGKPEDKKTEKEDGWIYFKFGDFEANIPLVIYEQFKQSVEALQKQGVDNLINQVEYLCVSFLNSPDALIGDTQSEERQSA